MLLVLELQLNGIIRNGLIFIWLLSLTVLSMALSLLLHVGAVHCNWVILGVLLQIVLNTLAHVFWWMQALISVEDTTTGGVAE
jgi:hypothetical protein